MPENEPPQRKTKLRAARHSLDYSTGVPWIQPCLKHPGVPWIQPCLKPNHYVIPALGPVHFPFASTPLNLGSCRLHPESQPTQPLISRAARLAYVTWQPVRLVPLSIPLLLWKALAHVCSVSGQSDQAPGFSQNKPLYFWQFFLPIWSIRL